MLNVDKFIDTYKTGNIIYSPALARYYNISVEEAYKILREYENKRIVEPILQVICPKCQKVIINYDRVINIPDNLKCPTCNFQLKHCTIGNAIVAYKKL